jgi:hypothetical protein
MSDTKKVYQSPEGGAENRPQAIGNVCGVLAYSRYDADAIFESLEADNQQLRKLLTEVEGVAPEKWIALTAERDALKAARIAYASEFPADENGDPDVGNIHANIRAMKARVEELEQVVEVQSCECSADEACTLFQRAKQAKADLAREQERSAHLEKALGLAVKDVNEHLQENRAPGSLSPADYLASALEES